jgi:hypothetical protein
VTDEDETTLTQLLQAAEQSAQECRCDAEFYGARHEFRAASRARIARDRWDNEAILLRSQIASLGSPPSVPDEAERA